VTIDALPNEVLLEIFDFYLALDDHGKNSWLRALGLYIYDTWHTLVHVCPRWRRLMFESPRRLDLRHLCDSTRPVRKKLNVWPELPIIVSAYITNPQRPGTTNIIHALKQHDCVCRTSIMDSPNSLLKKIAAVKKPFPALTEVMRIPMSFLIRSWVDLHHPLSQRRHSSERDAIAVLRYVRLYFNR